MDTEHLRRRILVPVTLAIVALLATSVAGIYWFEHGVARSEQTRAVASIERLFASEVQAGVAVMNGAIDLIEQNERCRSAWAAKDRPALLAETAPVLDSLRSNHRIDYLSFHDTDRRSFLRVHKPDRYGDLVNRFTVIRCAKTGEPVSGFEIDTLGTFALRIVRPLTIADQAAGYIELGIPVEHVIARVRTALDIEFLVVVDKKFLAREHWQEWLDMLGREGDWEQFPESVVVAASIDRVPAPIVRWINTGSYRETGARLDVSLPDRRYVVGAIGLNDVASRHIGDIVFLHEMTSHESLGAPLTVVVFAAYFAVAASLFLLLYYLVDRVEGQIADARAGIIEEHQMRETEMKQHIEQIKLLNDKLQRQLAALQAGKAVLETQLGRSRENERNARSMTDQVERVLGLTNTRLAIIDSDYSVRYVDAGTREAYGNPAGRRCYEYFMDRIEPCEECGVEKAISTKTEQVTEQVLPKEHDLPVQVVTVPYRNDEGEWLAAELRADITERKRIEQEMLDTEQSLRATLEESEQMLKSTLNSTADGILTVNEEGRITHASARFAEMWRIPKELLETRDNEKILDHILGQLDEPEAFLSQLRDLFRRLYQTPEKDVDTISFKDGRVFERFSSPVMKGETIAGRVWSFRDVTEQKHAELERLNRERLQGVLELAGAACHELNQPMQAVTGYCELLMERIDKDDSLYGYLQTIYEQVCKMAATTRKLQNITRYETHEYLAGIKVIDIDKSSELSDGDA